MAALGLCATSSLAQVDLSSERPPGESPTRIEVGFYLIDLMQVIDRDGTFEADLFVVTSWKDTRLLAEKVRVVPVEEVWSPSVVVSNERAVASRLPSVVEIQPDGTVTLRQRLVGMFSSALDLSRFPMDNQTLELRFVVYGNSLDEVVLVESTTFPGTRSMELAITDWSIGEMEVTADAFAPAPGYELSSLSVRLPASRLVGYYVVQMLVPLVLIIAMSWAPFWIDPSVINVRVSISVSTVLTLIAYRFMTSSLVPKLPYLTLADHLLLGATVLVAVTLLLAVIGAYLTGRSRDAAVVRIDRLARVVLPLGFLVLFGAVTLSG